MAPLRYDSMGMFRKPRRSPAIAPRSLLTVSCPFQFNAVGVVQLVNPKSVSRQSYRFWLFGLIFATVSDLYKIDQHFKREEYFQQLLQTAKQEDEARKYKAELVAMQQ